MRRRVTALALSAALAAGLTACGGDASETSDIVPKSTPDLVAPENTGLPAQTTSGDDERTGTSTSTTSTDETTADDTTATPAAPTQQAPAQSQTPAAPAAGGQQAPAQTQPQQQEQGETGGNSGGFSDFCAENPGACPDE